MKDISSSIKLLVLLTLSLYCKPVQKKLNKLTCLDSMRENEVIELLESFLFEVEEVSISVTPNTIIELKEFLPGYLSTILSTQEEGVSDSFTFTDGSISCKITFRMLPGAGNSKRHLETACAKNNQCFTGEIYAPVLCVDRFENGIQKYTTATNGGKCIPNTCILSSDHTVKVVMSKNRDVMLNTNEGQTDYCVCVDTIKCLDTTTLTCITASAGKINEFGNECRLLRCNAANMCFNQDFQCEASSSTILKNALDGSCYSSSCLLDQATITAESNLLTLGLSVSGDNVVITFTDSINILANVDKNRYYSNVFLTDSKGNYLGTAPDYISGTATALGSDLLPNSITLSETLINDKCALVDTDPAKAYLGRVCYFMAIIADSCSYLKDLVVYTHLAQRTIVTDGTGVYVLDPDIGVASQFEDLRVDYCSYVVDNCILSTDFTYIASFCTDSGKDGCATTLASTYKFKRGDTVHTRIAFSKVDGSDFSDKKWELISAMTKLYSATGVAISTAEEVITFLTPVVDGNNLYFDFVLTPALLFYDDQTVISNILKLLMVIKVTSTTTSRNLEVGKIEILPELGSLLELGIDADDLQEYTTIKSEEDSDSHKKKVIIAVVCSVVGFLIICLGILLYFCIGKKGKKASKEAPVNQLSTMGDRIEPDHIQVQVAETTN
jgi:hypothetical protein